MTNLNNKTLLPFALFLIVVGCSTFNAPNAARRTLATSGPQLDDSGYFFDPQDTSCDGYPKLKVQTLPGTCLGMVLSGKALFKMPRTIIHIPDTDSFLVADMGGWKPKAGKLFLLRKRQNSPPVVVELLSGLDLPHGLALNPIDRLFYLGENKRITRFQVDLERNRVVNQQIVVDNLPDVAKHMHPLTHFVFNPQNGDLYINSGAPTDHCYQENGDYKKRCPDEIMQRMATIQKISADKLSRVGSGSALVASDIEVVAYGLRNSMAMAIHNSGRFLIQGENSRDFPELEEPYEELNVIRLDRKDVVKHYGWPYCYNNHAVSPEWDALAANTPSELRNLHGENPFYCGQDPVPGLKDYQRPYSLIPPHAAPLAAEYYNGQMFNDLFGGQLLMSWHGHRTTGQRFVAYRVNKEGLPVLSRPTDEHYNFNLPNGCPERAPFNPRGGLRQHFAKYQEIISGWGPIKGVRPKGAPVGFTADNDGSIWIVEDKNKTIVRLARSPDANYQQSCPPQTQENKDFNIPLLAWRHLLTSKDNAVLRVQYNEIVKGLRTEARCLKCHEQFISKDLSDTPDEFTTMDFFVRSQWLIPGEPDKSLLYGALVGNGIAPAMPPAGLKSLTEDSDGQRLLDTIKEWILNLPKDVDSRWKQVVVNKNLNVRPAPTITGRPCGQFQAGDIAYIDPRPAAKIASDGRMWTKTYLLPKHTRLSGTCAQPIDGVYYIAL